MYTYKVVNNGYVIMLEGRDYVVQETFIPYPASTIEESAELHMQELSKYRETEETEEQKIQELEQQLLEVQQYIVDKEVEELLNQGGM